MMKFIKTNFHFNSIKLLINCSIRIKLNIKLKFSILNILKIRYIFTIEISF